MKRYKFTTANALGRGQARSYTLCLLRDSVLPWLSGLVPNRLPLQPEPCQVFAQPVGIVGVGLAQA